MRLIVATGVGFFAGFLNAWLFLGNQLHDWVASSHALWLLFAVLHMPAMVLLKLWTWLNLPPYGDGGLVMFPSLLTIQWTIIGSLCGICWQRMQTRNTGTQHAVAE